MGHPAKAVPSGDHAIFVTRHLGCSRSVRSSIVPGLAEVGVGETRPFVFFTFSPCAVLIYKRQIPIVEIFRSLGSHNLVIHIASAFQWKDKAALANFSPGCGLCIQRKGQWWMNGKADAKNCG